MLHDVGRQPSAPGVDAPMDFVVTELPGRRVAQNVIVTTR